MKVRKATTAQLWRLNAEGLLELRSQAGDPVTWNAARLALSEALGVASTVQAPFEEPHAQGTDELPRDRASNDD